MAARRAGRCKLYIKGIFQERPRMTWETKQGHQNSLKAVAPTATENIRHSPTPSNIYMKHYNKGLFTKDSII